MERFVVRVWVPDEPGALATLTARVAQAGGNVVGLEVLERVEGAALDEVMIEVEAADLIDALSGRVASMRGTKIEEVRAVAPDAEDHGLRVIEGAIGILNCVRPTAALAAFMETAKELFDADWCALVDPVAGRVVMHTSPAPPTTWLLEVAAGGGGTPGVRPGAAGVSGFEVVTRPVEEVGLTACVGRPIPFRRREVREIEMLVRVTDRTCRSARTDRIPTHWTSKGGVFGS